MIRIALWLLGGLMLGGIVHLGSVLVLPRTATQDAYSRLAPISPLNAVAALPVPTPDNATLPFMDPAFAVAVCRYDLSGGPLKITTPVSQSYTSLSFHTRFGVAYYAINDRAAGRRIIELELMTAAATQPAARGRGSDRSRPADRRIADADRPRRAARARLRAERDAGRARHPRRRPMPAQSAGVTTCASIRRAAVAGCAGAEQDEGRYLAITAAAAGRSATPA